MKTTLLGMSALLCIGSSACVAGPGGANNAANRTLAGAALGTLLGGLAGSATGSVAGGAVVGAIAGGGIGAIINPNSFGGDPETRGYCYTVDTNGQPITIVANEAECRIANGQPATPTRGR